MFPETSSSCLVAVIQSLLRRRGVLVKSASVGVLLLSVVGFSFAADSWAAIKRSTHVEAQGLGPALEMLAKEHGFQVLYRTEIVGTLRSRPLQGEFSTDEALRALLDGTGLTYRVLGDQAITIVAVGGGSSSSAESSDKETSSRVNAWQSLRLAQATSSQTQIGTDSGSVAGATSTPEGTLEELVVTAQKREERLQNVPISISVLSGAALDKQSSGVAEALSQVAGVSLSASGMAGGGQVTIRGVSANFPLLGGSSTSAYYIDAIPFGFVKSAIAPDASAYDMQRIEVLRGPQGTLYGASALNGVVRLLTTDPDLEKLEFKGRANVSNTERGDPSYGGDVAVNVPL